MDDQNTGGQGERGVESSQWQTVSVPVVNERSAPSAPSTPAALDELFACAERHACDCPIPAPPDLDAAYSEEGIEAWLNAVEETCSSFAGRQQVLDCQEFPCILMLEAIDPRAELGPSATPSIRDLTCGHEGPEVVFKGLTGEPGHLFHLLVIRPRELLDYERREYTRTQTMTAPAPGADADPDQ